MLAWIGSVALGLSLIAQVLVVQGGELGPWLAGLGLEDHLESVPDDGVAGADAGVDSAVDLATEGTGVKQLWTRRQILLAAAAGSLAACGRATMPGQELDLWTLQLAPKFNPYFGDLLADWTRSHPGLPVRWTDLPWVQWNASCWWLSLPARL